MTTQRERVTLNRELIPDSNGFWHLVPLGRFPAKTLSGKTIEQVIDELSISELVKNFEPKVLVDFEHRSHDKDGDTTAAAWITKVEARNDGLWGCPELSDIGLQAVSQKRYRFISPVLELDMIDAKSGRPVRLSDAGLTNKANLRAALTPLFNKNSEGLTPEGERGAETTKNGETLQMKSVLKALGLKEDAEEASALTAVNALVDQVTSLKSTLETATNKVAEFEKKDLDAKVGAALETHKGRITGANKDDVEAALRKDFDGTVKVLNAMIAPKADTTTLNRGDGKPPTDTATVTLNKEREDYVEKVRVENRFATKAEAWTLAAQQKPELFVTK